MTRARLQVYKLLLASNPRPLEGAMQVGLRYIQTLFATRRLFSSALAIISASSQESRFEGVNERTI